MALASYDFHGLTEQAQKQLGKQVHALVRDAGHVAEALRRSGSHIAPDMGHMAMDLADGALHTGAKAARQLTKQAYRAGKIVHDDPLPMIAAVVGIACLLNLVIGGTRHPEMRH